MDVHIVGAGVAGSALALFLRRAGLTPTVHEARAEHDAPEGLWLGVSPNGRSVLRELGIEERLAATGLESRRVVFWNGRGKRLGVLPSGDAAVAGFPLMMERAALQRAIAQQARAGGIPLRFGERLSALREGEATFSSGESVRPDLLVGCDGLRSATRRLAMPDAPQPRYRGLVGVGGFAKGDVEGAERGDLHLVFGRRASFGHVTTGRGETWWFATIEERVEPSRDRLGDAAPWLARVQEAARLDSPLMARILAAPQRRVAPQPIHEMPALPAWHRGRTVLIGDAAHAIPPHAGQGAALALENALCLARSLRDLGPDAALPRFEALRRDRVERVAAIARRSGDAKARTSWGEAMIRDLALPVILRGITKRAVDPAIHAYPARWAEPVA